MTSKRPTKRVRYEEEEGVFAFCGPVASFDQDSSNLRKVAHIGVCARLVDVGLLVSKEYSAQSCESIVIVILLTQIAEPSLPDFSKPGEWGRTLLSMARSPFSNLACLVLPLNGVETGVSQATGLHITEGARGKADACNHGGSGPLRSRLKLSTLPVARRNRYVFVKERLFTNVQVSPLA